MLNIEESSSLKREALGSVVDSILLHGVPIWYKALETNYRKITRSR